MRLALIDEDGVAHDVCDVILNENQRVRPEDCSVSDRTSQREIIRLIRLELKKREYELIGGKR